MKLGYRFTAPVDPMKPLDVSDPPPKGWKSVDFDADFDRDRYHWCKNPPSDEYTACVEWETREMARHGLQPPKVA